MLGNQASDHFFQMNLPKSARLSRRSVPHSTPRHKTFKTYLNISKQRIERGPGTRLAFYITLQVQWQWQLSMLQWQWVAVK
jgi:hypothetical protein